MFGESPRGRWPVVLLAIAWGCGDGNLLNTHAGEAVSASADALCQSMADGEALVGVGPEGEAWVEGDAGLRHIAPDGTSTAVDARFTRADQLVAWDTTSAFVVGDNALWNATVEGSETLSLPGELGKPRFICGDPRNAGGAFVVTTRGLFERRNNGWQRWDLPLELIESMELRDLQGACSGELPVLYLTAQQSLWEVHYGENAFFRQVADLTDMQEAGADVRVGFVALRDGEMVRFDGSGWAPIPFNAGEVTHMSVADGVLWASVGTDLYRRDRFENWERLDIDVPPFAVSAVRGYAAGGAWVTIANQLCHVGHRETLRVNGVRPYGRVGGDSMPTSLTVSADPAMGTGLTATLDGRSLQVTGAAGAWTLAGANAFDAGWHTLALNVAAPEGVVRRTVRFLVEGDVVPVDPGPDPDPTVFWESDIRPIYEANCAVCHGENGNQTFMGSYEAFSALGERALDFVSRGEMPPAPAPPLSEAEATLLETWVQEGMAP